MTEFFIEENQIEIQNTNSIKFRENISVASQIKETVFMLIKIC